VILKTHEELRHNGQRAHVHPGLLYLKQRDGRHHPLLRAVAPEKAAPVLSLIDATMGVAGDAIHIARILPEVSIMGCEASPVLHALLEEGLPRLRADASRPWSDAVRRIKALWVNAGDYLAGLSDDSVDVVYLDPMFTAPLAAPAGFTVVRQFALDQPPSLGLLDHARRVARMRVVVKIPGATEVPPWRPPEPGWNRRVRGQAVDYLACEMELHDPEWDEPTLGNCPPAIG
jgi:hypothetical protein